MRFVDLPTQLYMSSRELKLGVPVTNREYPWVKPKGGLWTSTYTPDDPEGESDWIRWIRGEQMDWLHPKGTLLTVPAGLKVVEIDSYGELLELLDIYGIEDDIWKGMGSRKRHLDYGRMADDGFDGIHLTEFGQGQTRFSPREHSESSDLYGWDCESTLWLHSEKLVIAGEVPIRPYEIAQSATAD